MASIVLLLSELLGGESTSVMAADWYMSGHSLREFRPVAAAAAVVAKGERPAAAEARRCEAEEKKKKAKEESFEDLAAMSRIAVDVMWP